MLYVVSTPIGNLQDITLRALEVLKTVDFIICEDTRVSSVLLKHFQIVKEMISSNAVSEEKKVESLINRIKSGAHAAVITDAGTPGISDPGTRLIQAAIRADIQISPIPGASAFLAALMISGLPCSRFTFLGFAPQKKGRQKWLTETTALEHTVVFYESPHRMKKLLDELCTHAPERLIIASRELTKMFEESVRGKPQEVLEHFSKKEPRGEFVVILAPIGWREDIEY